MHSVLIADLAALVSHHGPAILRGAEAIPPEAVTLYWTSSRNRFELWHRTMARFRDVERAGDFYALRNWWLEHIGVLEEVLVTEMLTRVIAGLAVGMDESDEKDELSPVTHAVHLNHLDARNRVQKIMLHGRGNTVQDAVRLNRLRQGVERWTDALIGRLSSNSPAILKYGFDLTRAAEYAEETQSYGHGPARETAAWLMNAAMHDMLRMRTSPLAALPEANRAVAASVMLMLRPDRFDSIGVLKSLWLHRLQSGTQRTDRVLEELLAPDIDRAETAGGVEMLSEPYFERWFI